MLINEGDIMSDVEDPRLLVTPRNESTRLLVKGFPPYYTSFNQKELQNKHDIYRLIHGLAEGGEVLGHIPLEVNLDLLNNINFQKGCYIGQELVARTKFKVSCGHGMCLVVCLDVRVCITKRIIARSPNKSFCVKVVVFN